VIRTLAAALFSLAAVLVPRLSHSATADESFYAKKAEDIPNVPNAIDFAKTADARILIDAGIHAPSAILRAYALPWARPKAARPLAYWL